MTRENPGPLLPLFGAVMALLAQALKILAIEEQNLVTLMRLDVVDRVGGLNRAQRLAQAARWLGLELMPPQPVPALRLVQVMPR